MVREKILQTTADNGVGPALSPGAGLSQQAKTRDTLQMQPCGGSWPDPQESQQWLGLGPHLGNTYPHSAHTHIQPAPVPPPHPAFLGSKGPKGTSQSHWFEK